MTSKAALDKEMLGHVQDAIACLERILAAHGVDPLQTRTELLLGAHCIDRALWALAKRGG